jgi:hypothetical protein
MSLCHARAMTSSRRFPPAVTDANGQALAYICARETRQQADIAGVLTFDEARRIAVNVAKQAAMLGGRAAELV